MPGEFIARQGLISRGNVVVTGSLTTSGSLTTTGTITAQTLVVQTITSSISSITGSTNFGTLSSNTHTFTGSINASGSATFISNISAAQAAFTSTTNPLIIRGTNASTQWTEYYYNTSTLAGYIGNGSGILTGANNSDFIIRSEADLVLATGNNRRMIIASSTGAATFSSSVKVASSSTGGLFEMGSGANVNSRSFRLASDVNDWGDFGIQVSNSQTGTTYTNALLINRSGNVGIGTNSPSTKLHINTTATAENVLKITNSTLDLTLGVNTDSGGSFLFENSNNALRFGTNATERMRITSGGFLKQTGTGTYASSTDLANEFNSSQNLPVLRMTQTRNSGGEEMLRMIYSGFAPNNTSAWFIYANDTSAARFYVTSAGGIGNFSANNVNLASDRRLKKDISPLSTEWDKLKQIEVVNFRYKDSTDETALYGAIAQQVQEIYPNLVIVTREATETEPEYYGLREQPFQWLTTKVLQEAMAKIETLEARVQELENK